MQQVVDLERSIAGKVIRGGNQAFYLRRFVSPRRSGEQQRQRVVGSTSSIAGLVNFGDGAIGRSERTAPISAAPGAATHRPIRPGR